MTFIVPARANRHWLDGDTNIIDHNPFADWLYGDYDERKLREYEVLHHIPIVSDYMDYLLDKRSDEEYLGRYGMDYSDIHDPRKLRESSSASRTVGSVVNFVSRNITRLYG